MPGINMRTISKKTWVDKSEDLTSADPLFEQKMNAIFETIEQERIAGMVPEPFDPQELADLTRQQHPGKPKLANAFLQCTRQWPEGEFYIRLVDPKEFVPYGSGFWLQCPKLGELLIDVAEDGRLMGIEYMDRVMDPAR